MLPTIVLNPRSDVDFRAFVDELLDGRHPTPESLQAALRIRYPSAIVRPRGLSAERIEVWYVYRDGYWIPDRHDGEWST